MYPVAYTTPNGGGGGGPRVLQGGQPPPSTTIEILNYCVPDCSTANSLMVNNPVLGRCEYLGPFCKYGNYIDGCIETHDSCKTLIYTIKTINRTVQA
jgi:hypothetical protein